MRASLWLTVGKREQVQAAINDLQSVVTKMPENPVLRFNLARALIAKATSTRRACNCARRSNYGPTIFHPGSL